MKAYDIRMTQPLQQSHLVYDTYAFRLWLAKKTDDIPRHLDALDGVVRVIDVLVGTSTIFFREMNAFSSEGFLTILDWILGGMQFAALPFSNFAADSPSNSYRDQSMELLGV